MGEPIRLLIIDDIKDTRENIRRLLLFEKELKIVGEAANGEEGMHMAEELQPDVILMDINMPVLNGIDATELISLRVPQAAIIIMSVQGEKEYLKKAMLAGARDYLVKPFSGDELINTVRQVYDLARKRQATQATSQLVKKEKRKPQVVTIFSTKGGVGKTTLGTNLAAALAMQTKYRVALIDLDLQFGDVAIMLNIAPSRTIADLVEERVELDSELLENYLITHQTGAKILLAPARPEQAELVLAEHVERIITILKENYDFVLIDTPPSMQDVILSALDLSDKILLLTTLDLPTIKNIKLCLELMQTLGYPEEKVKLILNKASREIGINYRDLERTLKYAISLQVPTDDYSVISSVNKGIPLVMSYPDSPVARSIEALVQSLVHEYKQKPEVKAEVKTVKLGGKLKRLFG